MTAPAERERLFGQYDHVRVCGNDYGERLEQTGFAVREVDYVVQFDLATRTRYGLWTGEPFYVCVPRLDPQEDGTVEARSSRRTAGPRKTATPTS